MKSLHARLRSHVRKLAVLLLIVSFLLSPLIAIRVNAFSNTDYESWYVDPQNPEVQNMIRQFCVFPLESNLMQNARFLYIALSRRFHYDDSHVHAWQTIPEMLRQNKGVCCDFARLYYSLLRGIGWPEHCIEIVYAPVYDLFGSYMHASHAWVEIKTPSPYGTPLALYANESAASLEGQRVEMGFNDTYVSLAEITQERTQTLRTSGWVNRSGWVPIDPTAAVCWNEIPIINWLSATILFSLYLTFGYGVFPFNGYFIHYDEIQPYYGPWDRPPIGDKPRRDNLAWGSLSIIVEPHESFNVSYLHDVELNRITLGMTIEISSNVSTNVEIRNQTNVVTDTASGITNYSKLVHWGTIIPPGPPQLFPANLGIYWFVVNNPQSSPANVTFTLTSDGVLLWLGGNDAINQTLYEQYSVPHVDTCNESGYSKNMFRPDENVYVKGAGYFNSTQMTIYVIPDGENATTSNAKASLSKTTEVNGTFAVSLLWSPPLNVGNYDIWVDVNENGLFDDNDTLDAKVDGAFLFSVLPLDIVVVNVFTSKTIVGQGHALLLSATIQNQGYFTESFSVTIFASLSIVGQTVLTLTGQGQTTMTVVWNTTGFVYGSYTVSAYALTVSGETNITNNNLTGGTVYVGIPGDVNGDGTVNILDAIVLANHFLETSSSPRWNQGGANADIDSDNVVNILDAVILSDYFGQHYP